MATETDYEWQRKPIMNGIMKHKFCNARFWFKISQL
jgi:hypothetical protein